MNCDNFKEQERQRIPQCEENWPDQLPNTYFFTPEDITYYPYDPSAFRKKKLLVQKRDPRELDQHINT